MQVVSWSCCLVVVENVFCRGHGRGLRRRCQWSSQVVRRRLGQLVVEGAVDMVVVVVVDE